MNFPYENKFRIYCKQKKQLADSTIALAAKSITVFWNYYSANLGSNAAIDNVTSSDLRNFLDSLEQKMHFKSNTVNKYLSHLKMYFIFLNEYGYISSYPLLTLRGNKFDRKQKYVINWMEQLPEITQIKKIHPATIKMMAAIATGYKPKEILTLRANTLIDQIKNPVVKDYLKTHTDFTQDADPYLFATKNGDHYASDFNINQSIAADRDLIGMQLTSHKLRMSYVYSILSNPKLSDDDLLKTLRISLKSLNYYRKNMMLYVETEKFELKKMKLCLS